MRGIADVRRIVDGGGNSAKLLVMLMQNDYSEVLKRFPRLLNSFTLIHLFRTGDALRHRIVNPN